MRPKRRQVWIRERDGAALVVTGVTGRHDPAVRWVRAHSGGCPEFGETQLELWQRTMRFEHPDMDVWTLDLVRSGRLVTRI